MNARLTVWRSRSPLCHLITLVIGVAVSRHGASAQSAYTLTDLGSLPGYGQSVATAINAAGQVAGWVYDRGYNKTHAVLFADGSAIDLGTLPGNVFSIATALNAAGHVAGGSAHLNFEGRGFVYRDGGLTDLGTLRGNYCLAFGINGSDQIVGETGPGPMRAFLYGAGRMTDLGTLGGDNSSARAINDAGQIVGKADTGALTFGATHAFLYASGRMTDLGTLGGAASVSWANAINASGQVVGGSSVDPFGRGEIGHAFQYSGGRMAALGQLGPFSNSEASGINNSGTIVGSAYQGSAGHNFDNQTAQHAFVYTSGRMFDLNNFVVNVAGWVLLHATAINDNGQIAGYGVNPDGDEHAFLLTPLSTPMPLILTRQPASQHATVGSRVSFSVAGNERFVGTGLVYQWKKNGVAIAGATASSLTLPSVSTADMGFYSVVVGDVQDIVQSAVAILTVQGSPPSVSRLANISTRGFVPAGGALTPGFVLRGTGTKQLVVRAAGPALAGFGLAGALADPKLELIRASATAPLLANDDWGTSTSNVALVNACAAVGAFALPNGSKDAAMLAALDTATTGAGYSVRIAPTGAAASGLVLAEVYDADPPNSPVQIINVSTLGFVGTGANALVPGFVIGGVAAKSLLIRAVGPGLAAFGVTGALADPRFDIIPLGQNLTVASNDNWDGSAALASAFAQAGAFALTPGSKDAALLVRLPPGGYTVTVSGAGNTTGTALVEIYDLDP